MANSPFGFENSSIGRLLRQGRLEVPPNQRSYAWREKQVRALLEDFDEAITEGVSTDEYFMGTIVLIQQPNNIPTIVDGQQRIATATIVLARIRDLLKTLGRERSANSIEEGFLSSTDLKSEVTVPRITMNLEDHQFFLTSILIPYKKNKPEMPRGSNRRLWRSSTVVAEFLDGILKEVPVDRRADRLIRWVDFIEHRARVLVVTASDEIGAYRMFETLNDRGLRASQADILKNYLFSKSGSRLAETQMMWSTVTSALDPLSNLRADKEDEDDINKNDMLIQYIRHLWITKWGETKARELAAKIKERVQNENKTMEFITDASGSVQDYVSLWSSKHPKWIGYRTTTRQHIETISEHLQVEQIRPLLFAVAKNFSIVEADKAFSLFVSWSVRFLIFGGRGGMLDKQYSLRAEEVGTKKITTARQLRDNMDRYVPSDAEFEEAFGTARVSRPNLARYYLRAMEKAAKQMPQPEYVENADIQDITLEHVMPLKLTDKWDVDSDQAETAQKFLGNMCLLRSGVNKDIGNKPFSDKKGVFLASGYVLTKEIAGYERWTLEDIRDRQRRMAKLAVKTWPLTLG